MELESTIKSILKTYPYTQQLYNLYLEQFFPLKSILKEKLAYPDTVLKRIQQIIFMLVFIIVNSNQEKYVERKILNANKNVLDPSNYVVNIKEDECARLIRSYLFVPDLIASVHDKKSNHYKDEITNLNIKLASAEGEIKAYIKALEDKEEKAKKSIDNMAQSYIETCEIFKTHKPKNWMLEKISGVEERIWKLQRSNELFLKNLLAELLKKFNQSKSEKKENFWQKAIDYVNTKIDFISNPDKFKLNYGFTENKDYDKGIAKSKGDKIIAIEKMKEKEPIENLEELRCGICGELIDSGKWCDECLEEFK